MLHVGKLVTLECTVQLCAAHVVVRASEQPKSPETEPNYKAICRQLTQKNQQLGKAYKTIKAQYDELKESCQDMDEQLNQAQQDADEMAVK